MGRILGSVSPFHAVVVMMYSISFGRLQEDVCVCVCWWLWRDLYVGVAGEFLLMWLQ